MELDEPAIPFAPAEDRRPRMDEPLPVRLVAVADVTLPASAGLEAELDGFYVGLLGFERMADGGLVYRAENFALRFVVQEGLIERDTLRAQGIEVRSLAEAEQKLLERQIDYVRQKGVEPGQECLLLRDPAGNWVELVESKRIG